MTEPEDNEKPETETAVLPPQEVRAVVEALIFASTSPITPREITQVMQGVPKEAWIRETRHPVVIVVGGVVDAIRPFEPQVDNRHAEEVEKHRVVRASSDSGPYRGVGRACDGRDEAGKRRHGKRRERRSRDGGIDVQVCDSFLTQFVLVFLPPLG